MNKKQKRTRIRILLAIALFVVVSVVAELLPLSTWLGSETAALWAEFALFLVPYLIAGYDVLLRAAKNIGHGQVFDENFLMSVATIGAFALVLFPDSDPHMAEGAAVMLFYQVGELFQSYAVGKSRKSIADMMDIAPDFANVERDGQLVQVDPYEVAVGDEIVVKAGERVPLDGVVLSGTSQLDTAALTGESVPREVREGDEIISGCVNMTGLITVRVTKPFGESTVSRILELVENAAEKKAKTENFITRFARYYTPAVVGIAVLLAVVPPLLLGGGWSDWVQRGLIFLVVSCPCALVISVPLSFFGGIGGASRLGILVKGSNYLETLAGTETVVFDKTGTVTEGAPSVTDVVPAPGVGEERLLELAVSIEGRSEPPLARAVCDYARSRHAYPLLVEDFKQVPGEGVAALVDDRPSCAGNLRMMEARNVAVGAFAEEAQRQADMGKTPLFFAQDGELLGIVAVADTVKPSSAAALAVLKGMGIRTVMLTGDNERTAAAIQRKVGADEVIAGVLPDGKEREIRRLAEQGRVAMVGDGINDAPALARADVGIAIGAGTDVAIESADIVLMRSDLLDVPVSIQLSRATLRNIKQNLFWALVYNAVCIPVAAGALSFMGLNLNPMIAAAAMSLSSVCVVTNALRLRGWKPDLPAAPSDAPASAPIDSTESDNPNEKESTMEKTLNVEGMMCQHCVAHVKRALEGVAGVEEAVVDLDAGTATAKLAHDVPEDVLAAAIVEAGYGVK